MLRKAKLTYLIQREIDRNNHNGITPVEQVLNTKNSTLIRLMWLVVVIICLTICCYQTYERLAHYLSGPFTVDVEFIQMNRIKFPALQLASLYTRGLIPYLNGSDNDNCRFPLENIMSNTEIKVDNYTKLWLDSNFTSNLDYIKAIRYVQILHKSEFQDGKIVEQSGNYLVDISQKFLTDGLSLVVNTDLMMIDGLQFKIQLHKDGHCVKPSVFASIYDDGIAHHSSTLYNNKESEVDLFLEKYHFLQSKPPYCETDKKLLIKCFEECRLIKGKNPPCRLPYMTFENSLPDCSKESNKTLVKEIYLAARKAHKCNCKRPCDKTYYYLRRKEKETVDKDTMILNIIAFGNSFYMMTESYIYNFINLLIDMGGNFGFSLGLSLLSLIHIGHKSAIIFHKSLLTHEKPSREAVLIKSILGIMKKNSGQQVCCHAPLYLIVSLIGALFALYVIVMRVQYYISEPTMFTITLEEGKTYPFIPNILFCGSGEKIDEHKLQFASKKNMTDVCQIDTLDLLDEENISVTKLWDMTKPNVDEGTWDLVTSFLGFELNVSWSYVAMHSGLCLQFEIDETQEFPTALLALIALVGEKSSCNNNLLAVYWREPGETIYSIIKTEESIVVNGHSVINFKILKKVLLNLKSQPCVPFEEFKKCRSECYKKKMSQITCSLPFAQLKETRECTTSSEAKTNLVHFLNLSLHTNIVKECFCYPPCEDVTFQGMLAYSFAHPIYTLVTVEITDNLIRVFHQVLSYNEVALFCDIGNIFGLMIGFSLISIPNSVLSIWAYFKKILY